jgi:hypothetical protein
LLNTRMVPLKKSMWQSATTIRGQHEKSVSTI